MEHASLPDPLDSLLETYSAFGYYLISAPVEGHLVPGDVAIVVPQGALIKLVHKKPALERFTSLAQSHNLIPISEWDKDSIDTALYHYLPNGDYIFASSFWEMLSDRLASSRDVVVALSVLARLLTKNS